MPSSLDTRGAEEGRGARWCLAADGRKFDGWKGTVRVVVAGDAGHNSRAFSVGRLKHSQDLICH